MLRVGRARGRARKRLARRKSRKAFRRKSPAAKPSSRTHGVPSESFLTKEERETKQKAFGFGAARTRRLSARASRGAPSSAGYARALPGAAWAHRLACRVGPRRSQKKLARVREADGGFGGGRVGGGGGAHGERRRRRRRGGDAPGALYVPELGALAYAAGAEVVIERMGGDKTQAVLRGGHEGAITALARHADSRRVASASPAHALDADDATIRVWDSEDGRDALHGDARVVRRRSERFGVLAERDALLLSLGQDPEGAIRVFSLPSKRIDKHTRRSARGADADEDEDEIGVPPATLVSVVALAAGAPVASGAWLSPVARRRRRGRRDGVPVRRRSARRRPPRGTTPGPTVARRKRGKGKENDKSSLLRVSVPLRGRTRGRASTPRPCARPRPRLRVAAKNKKTKNTRRRSRGTRGDASGPPGPDPPSRPSCRRRRTATNAPIGQIPASGCYAALWRARRWPRSRAARPRPTMSAFTDEAAAASSWARLGARACCSTEHPLPDRRRRERRRRAILAELGELALDGANDVEPRDDVRHRRR